MSHAPQDLHVIHVERTRRGLLCAGALAIVAGGGCGPSDPQAETAYRYRAMGYEPARETEVVDYVGSPERVAKLLKRSGPRSKSAAATRPDRALADIEGELGADDSQFPSDKSPGSSKLADREATPVAGASGAPNWPGEGDANSETSSSTPDGIDARQTISSPPRAPPRSDYSVMLVVVVTPAVLALVVFSLWHYVNKLRLEWLSSR